MFEIKYWENEADRDMGMSEVYGTTQRCTDGIATARLLFKEGRAMAVEVIQSSSADMVYHLSKDSKEKRGVFVIDNRDKDCKDADDDEEWAF